MHEFRRDAEPRRDAFGEALRIAVGRRRAVCLASGAISAALRQIGSPSARQNSENAQRGSGSPGYHLPWP